MIRMASSRSRSAYNSVILVSAWPSTALAAASPYAWRIDMARVCRSGRGDQAGIPTRRQPAESLFGSYAGCILPGASFQIRVASRGVLQGSHRRTAWWFQAEVSAGTKQ